MSITIRDGRESDLTALVDLYNRYVDTSHVTFDDEPIAVDDRRAWFSAFDPDGPYRLLVAEPSGAGAESDSTLPLLGYASATRYRPKPGYRTSVETSVYLHPDHLGRGLGGRLYARLIERLDADPRLHRAYAGVALPNPASEALHVRSGYTELVTYREVGTKFGKFWDVRWFERSLD